MYICINISSGGTMLLSHWTWPALASTRSSGAQLPPRSRILQTAALPCQPRSYPANRRPFRPTDALFSQPTPYPPK